MEDHDEEELRAALEMSMQQQVQEPKKNIPFYSSGSSLHSPEDSPELKNRRLQRDLMASAAEKRMMDAKKSQVIRKPSMATNFQKRAPAQKDPQCDKAELDKQSVTPKKRSLNLENELSEAEANKLFLFMFGNEVTKSILTQWTHQGIRFSTDSETAIGLVQHESGPCGVLAAIQAYVLKYILFTCKEEASGSTNPSSSDRHFGFVTDDMRSRALTRAMCEMLFVCGGNKRAVIATLNTDGTADLDTVLIESASDMKRVMRIHTFTCHDTAHQKMISSVSDYESRMGALLFLVSALLSRGLEALESDRDDASIPLVTAPFGHASQEIVNLLLCGEAVPNVFDGWMDLGGGMFLKGVSTAVDVGFLTLLEYLSLCKVGSLLKNPRWPIWVVGSESHYTVLFATDSSSLRPDDEMEERGSRIRAAFESRDQSGGGGFITAASFRDLLTEIGAVLPPHAVDGLCGTGYVVWSEFSQVLLDLDCSAGGLRDLMSVGPKADRVFRLYHFNGLAKSVPGGTVQKPRLCAVTVTVPPQRSEFMMVDAPSASSLLPGSNHTETVEVVKPPEPTSKHAPLVDCIRTRWPRSSCTWDDDDDPPSIV